MRRVEISKGFMQTKQTRVENGKKLSVNVVSFILNNRKFYAVTTMYLSDMLGKFKDVEIELYAKPVEVKCYTSEGKEVTVTVVCELKNAVAGTLDELKAFI